MQPVASPNHRFRRMKRSAALRSMVQENALSVADLIWPVFLCDGVGQRQPIASMPGVDRLSLDLVVTAAHEAAALGMPVSIY
jgi:porphobilinogen synthase